MKYSELTSSRIKEFRTSKGLSQAAFAGILGVNEVQFNKYENNKTAIPLRLISNIINSFPEVNPNWLMTGTGKMSLSSADSNQSSADTIGEKSLQYEPSQADYIKLQKEGLKDKEKIISLLETINSLEIELAKAANKEEHS